MQEGGLAGLGRLSLHSISGRDPWGPRPEFLSRRVA